MAKKKLTEASEIKRLAKIYSNLLPKQRELAEGLIAQAARIRVRLDELNADIEEHGLVELFQQSEKVEPYWRERPQAQLFVKLDKNYQSLIKQLNELLPPEEDPDDDLKEFI